MDMVYNNVLVWLKYHTLNTCNMLLMAMGILLLLSCSNSKYDFDFTSKENALECYQVFCDEVNSHKSLSSKEAIAVLSEWQEVRDTVLSYLEHDSTYHAHSWIPYKYSSIDDSIRNHLLTAMLEQKYTFKDVALIKRGASIYAKDQDVRSSSEELKPFFSRLDSIHIYNTDKESVLSMYRQFLSITQKNGIKDINDLQSFISMEDRIFRTFLNHLSEMDGENLSDISETTEAICNDIFRSASQGRLDSKNTLLYMSMRTNRRILLNAETSVEGIRNLKKMSSMKLNAYYWMTIQPFVAIDPFGMALLSDHQFARICKIADELHRLDRSNYLGEDSGKLPQMINLILKMYLTAL